MKVKSIHLILFGILVFNICTTWADEVKILSMKGEVKVRRGVEEFWQPAILGQFLENIDTILTGEKGEVILKLADGTEFCLGPNAIIDISDLRKISDRELFLFLTREKLNNVERRSEPTPLRIGNVSVIHGASRDTQKTSPTKLDDSAMEKTKNGIRALYQQDYHPNVIMKVKKVSQSELFKDNCGEFHYYLGSSLETLEKTGQATEVYHDVVTKHKNSECSRSSWIEQAKLGLERLK
jgi:hypothetical protein